MNCRQQLSELIIWHNIMKIVQQTTFERWSACVFLAPFLTLMMYSHRPHFLHVKCSGKVCRGRDGCPVDHRQQLDVDNNHNERSVHDDENSRNRLELSSARSSMYATIQQQTTAFEAGSNDDEYQQINSTWWVTYQRSVRQQRSRTYVAWE